MGDEMKKLAAYVPPIFLLIGIGILGFRRISLLTGTWLNTETILTAIIIGIYFIWILYEAAISHSDARQDNSASDHHTRELYAFSHGLTALTALWLDPIWKDFGIYQILGFALFLSGIIFRIWAIRTLGKYYSHAVRLINDHQIISTGPYRILRHPAYSGMICTHIGLTVFFLNYWTLSILILLFIPAIILRIRVEEKTLITITGYEEFMRNRKRIIPFIW